MARKASQRPPKYGLHKPSGQAVVYINRHPKYLGKYESLESREAYARVLAERVNSASTPLSPPDAANITINELLLRYFRFAKTYYVDQNGNPTDEYQQMVYAARPLRELFGSTRVADFGPKDLRSLQQHLVQKDELSRKVLNRHVDRVRRIFKWGVSEQLSPPFLYEALKTLQSLQQGRTAARETEPIQPVMQEHVAAVVAVAPPILGTMIQLQYLGGMRPQDIVQFRLCDVDRSGEVWVYQPQTHKTQWRGHDRKIYLGPIAQELLTPYLNRDPNQYLFSPVESEQWRNQQRREARKTPLTPSQSKRRAKKAPKRPKRERYDTRSYYRAITYAINKANRLREDIGESPIPHWSPNQLRHSRATDVRSEHGLEGAQLILGQKHARVTEVYAERDEQRARQIQHEMG